MGNRISFSDCLYKYFDTTFWEKTKNYVCDCEDFRSLHNIADNTDIEFSDITKKYVKIIRTEGTSVVFYIKILFCCQAEVFLTDTVEAICSWNIPLKEKGLTIREFGHGIQEPLPECNYKDDLVPIVRKEEYGKMADLFLQKVYGNETVEVSNYFMALNIVEKLNLHIEKCHLPALCTGRIVMVDSNLKFKMPDGEVITRAINAGTIFLDYEKVGSMSTNLITSTIIHECVHWVFHRCAFELGRLYCVNDDGFTCMKDKTTTGSTAAVGNKFIEIQTLGIVPRILLPLSDVRKEAEDIARQVMNTCRNRAEGLEEVLNTMKMQHGLSTESMRRSLISSGLQCFRGIMVYQDDAYLKSYCFQKDSLGSDETFDIPYQALAELFKSDNSIHDLIINGEYVYAGGHLVKNSPQYVEFRNPLDPDPTEYAILHADECFLKFKLGYPKTESTVSFEYGLSRVPSAMKKTYEAIYDDSLSKEKRTAAREKWENHKKEWLDCFRRTFGETLREMMNHFKKTGTYFDGRGISADQIYRICKSEHRPKLATIVALGGLFNMPYEVFIKFVELAGHDFFANKPEIVKYKEFMDDSMIYRDIDEFDKELERCGMKPLEKEPKAK